MSLTLKPYSAYKLSSAQWLGQVPEHWEVGRLRTFVTQVNEQTSVKKPDDVYVALEHVEGWTGRVRPASGDVMFDSQVKRFRSGDVLFGKLRPYLAKVARLPVDGVCVGEFLVLRARKEDLTPGFLENVLRSKPIIDTINSSTFGAKMPRADWGFVGNLLVAIPGLSEQNAIVHFLNYVDQSIGRYIRAKQKLVKLLEEQKQAIIYRAVTRGLDANVRLRSSGVEWLGDVPEGWDVQRVKNLFRLRTEKSGESHGLDLLSVYTHIGVRPRRELEERGNKASTTDDYWIVEQGDIVANKLLTWMGAIGVSSYRGVTSPAYDILKPIRRVDTNYFHYLFRTRLFLQQFKVRSRGIMDMRLRLYFDEFGQILAPVPPIEIQTEIVSFITDATAGLDRTIATARREITLLHEYRTRLTADVVTGKFDVQGIELRGLAEMESEDELVEVEEMEIDEDAEFMAETTNADN